MAYDDIQLLSSPGWAPRVVYYGMDASEAFSKGDVLTLASSGQVQEALTTGVTAPGLLGISMGGGVGPGGITINNPRTGTTYAENDQIPVIIPDSNTFFITENYTVAASAYQDTAPTVADMGATCSLMSISGVWGLDIGEDADEATCRIMDILNVRKESIRDTGETLATTDTYFIVFQIVAHMGTPDSGEVVDRIGET